MANVKKEVKQAYYDNHSDERFEDAAPKRDLSFLASDTVSVEWAMKIMKEATPNGYNYFQPEKISLFTQYFKTEPEIILAREASVAVYVVGVAEDGRDFDRGGDERQMLQADEHSVMTGNELIDRIESRQERYGGKSHQREPQELSDELREKLMNEPEVHRFWWD